MFLTDRFDYFSDIVFMLCPRVLQFSDSIDRLFMLLLDFSVSIVLYLLFEGIQRRNIIPIFSFSIILRLFEDGVVMFEYRILLCKLIDLLFCSRKVNFPLAFSSP